MSAVIPLINAPLPVRPSQIVEFIEQMQDGEKLLLFTGRKITWVLSLCGLYRYGCMGWGFHVGQMSMAVTAFKIELFIVLHIKRH